MMYYSCFSFFCFLKITMGKMASDTMIMRVFEGICSVDPGAPVSPGGGVSQEQLVIFLADALRGTAEERAPLVMAMSHGTKATVMTDQIREVSMSIQASNHCPKYRPPSLVWLSLAISQTHFCFVFSWEFVKASSVWSSAPFVLLSYTDDAIEWNGNSSVL